ncbi:hypothetical protein [Microbulbifer halophilus]|uniref:Lipoprotein n=1 Tax=Microbulbifer halophilus TaxID=453963 RepID=A0ABW5E5Y0_9GAMM|nr:hypothetical protein [Microbulbifer halophilus]MCW8126820.1 hypothetical protein [Microbulbifer halophilus]
MKWLLFTIIFSSSLVISSCGKEESALLVPMSALLGDPEKFGGKRVAVVGFLGRGSDLYLTEEHAKVDDTSSSLLLNLSEKERMKTNKSSCKNKYVEIVGVFGLVRIKGLTPRIGINKVASIKDKITHSDCIGLKGDGGTGG